MFVFSTLMLEGFQRILACMSNRNTMRMRFFDRR
jgi:hypothetical protein